MRAIVVAEFGPPENLLYARVDDPEPAPGQLRIDVKCAPVHLIEARMRAGVTLGGHELPELPTVWGQQVSGVVEAVADDVDTGWIGRRVIANATGGGYAELAVADTSAVYEIPDGVDFDAASVMLSTGPTTAAILQLAALRPGDTVVILAAAGAIGSLLTQHAQGLGAFVIGLASPSKLDRVTADRAVDYTAAEWPEQVRAALGDRQLSLVLEGVGGSTAEAAFGLLSAGGRAVSYGAASGDFARPPQGVEHQLLFESAAMESFSDPDAYRTLVERCLAQAADGTLVPHIQPFPLGDAIEAHEALEFRRGVGQVVLIP